MAQTEGGRSSLFIQSGLIKDESEVQRLRAQAGTTEVPYWFFEFDVDRLLPMLAEKHRTVAVETVKAGGLVLMLVADCEGEKGGYGFYAERDAEAITVITVRTNFS